jgi:hypothetical protein
MRLVKFGLFLALLQGCSPAPEPVAVSGHETRQRAPAVSERETPQSAMAAPAGSMWPKHTWIFEIENDRGSLGFTVPETDDEPFLVECERHARRVAIKALDPQRAGSVLVLVSRGERARYPSERVTDPEIDEGVYSYAEVSTSDAVLARFRETTDIAIGEQAIPLPVRTEADRRAVAALFAYCD